MYRFRLIPGVFTELIQIRPEKAAARRRRTARKTNRFGPIESLVLTAGKMQILFDRLPKGDACQQFWFLEIAEVRAEFPRRIVLYRPEDPGRESCQNEITELQHLPKQVFISIYMFDTFWSTVLEWSF